MVRHGSRSNTKNRTVTIKGSVRFALLIVRLKNGTVTVALAVKKTENDTARYGTDPVWYGTERNGNGSGDKFGPSTVLNHLNRQ